MSDSERIGQLVHHFAELIVRRSDAMDRSDAWMQDRCADRIDAVFANLTAFGDRGREALAALLTHRRAEVREMAACYLLRHRTDEALQVLRKEASGEGAVAYRASQAIKRWEDGEWHLDREEGRSGAPAEAELMQRDTASVTGGAESREDLPEVNEELETRSRVAKEFFGPAPGVGDRAVAAAFLAHGLVMSGGVLDAVEIMDEKQFEGAKAGYRYLGFDAIADILSRTKEVLDRGPEIPDDIGELEIELTNGVTLVYEPGVDDELEKRLDSEYQQQVPDDAALDGRARYYLTAKPDDFADL